MMWIVWPVTGRRGNGSSALRYALEAKTRKRKRERGVWLEQLERDTVGTAAAGVRQPCGPGELAFRSVAGADTGTGSIVCSWPEVLGPEWWHEVAAAHVGDGPLTCTAVAWCSTGLQHHHHHHHHLTTVKAAGGWCDDVDCVARDGAKRERQFCSAVRLGGEDALPFPRLRASSWSVTQLERQLLVGGSGRDITEPGVRQPCGPVVVLINAQHRPDTIRVPPPRIDLPKVPQPPRTRIDVQGGGSGSQHSVSGSIHHDIYRPNRGPTISIWGEGSHQRQPATGSHGQGQVGVGVKIPLGGRHRG
ncbi:hypothetical protein HPB51_018529 [Rhipicephalus microplus]|uniref:Uncharacterized protein n=1 Tax=Rhipicephalus microplus TaxID=6941 RepID=A0A9J6EI43_RHIMP|nr:hypothetical protein HPB51_018529 [Rhipicephalus microplus]